MDTFYETMRLWIGFFIAAALQAGVQTTPRGKPSFEAASIKRSSQQVIGFRFDSDRFVMNGQLIGNAIQFAYGPCDESLFLDNQIVGGPDWIHVHPYDIEAKVDSGGKGHPAVRHAADGAIAAGRAVSTEGTL